LRIKSQVLLAADEACHQKLSPVCIKQALATYDETTMVGVFWEKECHFESIVTPAFPVT
jgi:hypothetical protein